MLMRLQKRRLHIALGWIGLILGLVLLACAGPDGNGWVGWLGSLCALIGMGGFFAATLVTCEADSETDTDKIEDR